MAQIIELKVRTGLDYLSQFVKRGKNLRPVLKEIGEDLAESTKQRFASGTDPDGQAWAPNSAATLARYSSNFKRKKDGSLTKASATKLGAKKPGTGETSSLRTTINYQVYGDDLVGIGSPMVYASTFQYGAKAGEFGVGNYAKRKGSFPIPWGNIPARRFLGMSAADKAKVVELVRSYMLQE